MMFIKKNGKSFMKKRIKHNDSNKRVERGAEIRAPHPRVIPQRQLTFRPGREKIQNEFTTTAK